MPIFDYHCADCDRTVEVFVMGGEEARCPVCEGNRIEKLVSAFSVGGHAPAESPPPGGCGTCGDPRGPGSCRLDD